MTTSTVTKFLLCSLTAATSGLFLFPADSSFAQTSELKQTFLSPTSSSSERFGNSVAISGNNALIGTTGTDMGPIADGAVYLFDIVSGNLLQTFLNPTPDEFDLFGVSATINGNNVLIGASGDDVGAFGSGIAYLYDAVSGDLVRTFLNPNPDTIGLTGDRFGQSVAISGNNALISAFTDDTGAESSGIAYLFDITNGNLLQTFFNPTPNTLDTFGNSVAISGNNVLIGAREDDAGAQDSGAAYLFDTISGDLLQTFLNPTPDRSDFFGDSVAMSGNYVLVGAPFDDTGAKDSGTAYLFDAVNGNVLQTFLNPSPDSESQDVFGSSVAISGNNVLIGATNGDGGGTQNSGTAYLFDAISGDLLQTFLNPTPDRSDFFGDSVTINGNNILIGAPQDDTAAFGNGAAYLFQLTSKPTPVPEPEVVAGLAVLGIVGLMKRTQASSRKE